MQNKRANRKDLWTQLSNLRDLIDEIMSDNEENRKIVLKDTSVTKDVVNKIFDREKCNLENINQYLANALLSKRISEKEKCQNDE